MSEELEELVWSPDNELSDKVIDQFLVIARSVGTFARAVDEASTLKQPSLHMSAAAASRDITLFHAMDLLHTCKYNFSEASLKLVESGAPKLSCDQMEDWTTAEAGLFEEAMEKYGKVGWTFCIQVLKNSDKLTKFYRVLTRYGLIFFRGRL